MYFYAYISGIYIKEANYISFIWEVNSLHSCGKDDISQWLHETFFYLCPQMKVKPPPSHQRNTSLKKMETRPGTTARHKAEIKRLWGAQPRSYIRNYIKVSDSTAQEI